MNKKMLIKTLVALAMIAVVVPTVYIGGIPMQVLMAVIAALSGYEAAVLGAAERYEPSVVARYIISVASAFNKFYHECPILAASEEEKQARLVLVDAVQKVLKNSCSLLGMECPEEM